MLVKPVLDSTSRHDKATVSSGEIGERSTVCETKLKSPSSTMVSEATVERMWWMNLSYPELGAYMPHRQRGGKWFA